MRRAPRLFEKRFKLCVAWGANHNWGELQRAAWPAKAIVRCRIIGTMSCGSGAKKLDDFMEFAPR